MAKNKKPKHKPSHRNLNNDWKKWVNKVVGSPEAIQEALAKLKREPKDSNELQKVIFDNYQKELTRVLTEAEEAQRYTTY